MRSPAPVLARVPRVHTRVTRPELSDHVGDHIRQLMPRADSRENFGVPRQRPRPIARAAVVAEPHPRVPPFVPEPPPRLAQHLRPLPARVHHDVHPVLDVDQTAAPVRVGIVHLLPVGIFVIRFRPRLVRAHLHAPVIVPLLHQHRPPVHGQLNGPNPVVDEHGRLELPDVETEQRTAPAASLVVGVRVGEVAVVVRRVEPDPAAPPRRVLDHHKLTVVQRGEVAVPPRGHGQRDDALGKTFKVNLDGLRGIRISIARFVLALGIVLGIVLVVASPRRRIAVVRRPQLPQQRVGHVRPQRDGVRPVYPVEG